eukprot:TRINITY_DN26779_c0_g1_i2.p1 TRINITY_DN26779_c0_g1~~TRINITY_DN26779_c0_g1_i2.p1  ORF type:complete len:178 (+),score=35.09 TRINITY_DN26779_c0_g1_i2:262-795(+)
MQMVLVATFIPHSHPHPHSQAGPEISQEFMKAVIGMMEVLVMGMAYNLPQLRGEYTEKVTCLGIGWTLADSLLKRTAPLWIGACSTGEFDSKSILIALDGNLAMVSFMALSRLISRYNARDADCGIRRTVSVVALLHSFFNSDSWILEQLSPWVLCSVKAVWVAVLWSIAQKFFQRL